MCNSGPSRCIGFSTSVDKNITDLILVQGFHFIIRGFPFSDYQGFTATIKSPAEENSYMEFYLPDGHVSRYYTAYTYLRDVEFYPSCVLSVKAYEVSDYDWRGYVVTKQGFAV